MNILITGPTGVGKSSICEVLLQELNNAVYVEEYVSEIMGKEMLGMYLNKKISDITFQHYILDYYTRTFESIKECDYKIFERIPDDGLLCFSNLANIKGDLSDEDFLALSKRIREIVNKYNIPSYLNLDGSKIYHLKSDTIMNVAAQILSIIRLTDSNSKPKSIIIFLDNDDEEIVRRIHKRGRHGEENYTTEDLKFFTNHYRKLYSRIIDTERSSIRFVDYGSLI